jgi:hypothetical protein
MTPKIRQDRKITAKYLLQQFTIATPPAPFESLVAQLISFHHDGSS